MGTLTVTRRTVLFLAGASAGVALGLAVFLPDPCRAVTPAPDLARVGDTWRDEGGSVVLWIDPDGDAYERLACAG